MKDIQEVEKNEVFITVYSWKVAKSAIGNFEHFEGIVGAIEREAGTSSKALLIWEYLVIGLTDYKQYHFRLVTAYNLLNEKVILHSITYRMAQLYVPLETYEVGIQHL